MRPLEALAMFHSGIFSLSNLDQYYCFFLILHGVSSESGNEICLLACVIIYVLPNRGSSHTKSLELWQLLPQGRVLLLWKVYKQLHTYFNYSLLYKKIIKIENIIIIDTKSLNI